VFHRTLIDCIAKAAVFLSLAVSGYGAEPAITKIPWPKSILDFPAGEKVKFTSGRYEIRFDVPQDAEIQMGGGSGGPIVEITVRDTKSHWSATFGGQSVGERLLEDYHSKPQFELWGRGGGGDWSRLLYRYISGEYRCVRIDDFEENPNNHNSQNAQTATLPEEEQMSDTLYFIESRIPDG
jgi:hypothetical protein